MKNIKIYKILNIISMCLFILCALAVTSCSTRSKNLYVKRTKNGVDTICKSSTKQMSYKLSNGTSISDIDTGSRSYEITIYTSDYSINDSEKLSKDLFGIGLSVSDGGFQDNNYNASTAVLYASTDDTDNKSESTNLSTLVTYTDKKLDITKVGETQELIINTKVLKHVSDGTYIVDSDYPEQFTSVSLTISDDEKPIGTKIEDAYTTQEDFINNVLMAGDEFTADSEKKSDSVKSALIEYIKNYIRGYIYDNHDSSEALNIDITLTRDYDYANLEITTFKDDNYKIPFSYTLSDSSGNTNDYVYTGNLSIRIDKDIKETSEFISYKDNEERYNTEGALIERLKTLEGFNKSITDKNELKNYDFTISNYSDLDFVSNYTYSYDGMGFGDINTSKLEKAGKNKKYICELLDATQKVYYSKTYKNHIIVNSDGTDLFELNISYSESIGMRPNYNITKNNDDILNIKIHIIDPSTSLDNLKENFETKIADYITDNDEFETDVRIKLKFYRVNDDTCEMKIYIYGNYHIPQEFDINKCTCPYLENEGEFEFTVNLVKEE